jgi:hypothetical protein
MIENRGAADTGIRPEPLAEVEQIKIAIGRIEGVLEANKTELTPLLDDGSDVKSYRS